MNAYERGYGYSDGSGGPGCEVSKQDDTIRLLHFDGFERASQGGMHEFDDARVSSGRLLSLLGGYSLLL